MVRAQPGLPEEIAHHLAAAAVSPDPSQGGALAWRFDPRLRSKSPLPMTIEVLRCVVAEVAAPLLVLRSGYSPVPPEEETRAFLSVVRAPVTIATLPGTSHHLHLERPEEVAGRIRAAWDAAGR
jgi:pimeloyl-ACP methyl ester carboxylesterase